VLPGLLFLLDKLFNMNNLKKKYFCIDEKNVNTLFFINH